MDVHFSFFFFIDTAPPEIYTLSLHDALPILVEQRRQVGAQGCGTGRNGIENGIGESRLRRRRRSEEHTSELQSQFHLVCRLLLEKKKKKKLQILYIQTKYPLLHHIELTPPSL